jgi:hypothetical protein
MNQTETNDQNIDAAGAEARAASDQFSLNLTDLLPDANGEIVILNEGDDPCLNIVTDLRLLESGIAAQGELVQYVGAEMPVEATPDEVTYAE